MLHVGSATRIMSLGQRLMRSSFIKWTLMRDGQLQLEVCQRDEGHL